MATNQLLPPGSNKEPITIGPPAYESRESKGVWHQPKNNANLWKIYSSKNTYQTAYNAITSADHHGLPVPAFKGILGYRFRTGPAAAWQDVYILQTALITGTFFAMSQRGRENAWNQWVHTLNRQKDAKVLAMYVSVDMLDVGPMC